MRSSSIHCLFGTTALTLLSFDQASFADDALTAGSKSIVREFYTTVLINRHVDAAPRFLRPDYIQHNPNVPTGLNGFMDTFRARFAQPLPADYKRALLNIVAENDLVSSMCARHGRAGMVNITTRSRSTCFFAWP